MNKKERERSMKRKRRRQKYVNGEERGYNGEE
jgi:hypothetical protein